jgi:hypothetical protein
MATNEQILDLLATLDAVYGNKLDPAAIRAYYWTLQEYDGEVIEETGKDAVRFYKGWYPKPAELREIAERKQRARENDDTHLEDRRIRDNAYLLFDRYRIGQMTVSEFASDRAVKYCYRQHGLFVDFFEADREATI